MTTTAPVFGYLDLETTGLRPKLHEVVEVAYAIGDEEIVRFVPEHSLNFADGNALEINHYYEREINYEKPVSWTSPEVRKMRSDLKGVTLVGSSPSFDQSFLVEHVEVVWHHRLLDLPLYAAGLFGWETSRGLYPTVKYVRDELGFEDLPDPDHTAKGDVHATRELHHALRKLAAVREFISIELNAKTAKQITMKRKAAKTVEAMTQTVKSMESAAQAFSSLSKNISSAPPPRVPVALTKEKQRALLDQMWKQQREDAEKQRSQFLKNRSQSSARKY